MLQNSADVEKADVHGATPLIVASRFGRSACVKLLLEAGARLDKTDNQGKTALSWARDNGRSEVVKILEKWEVTK